MGGLIGYVRCSTVLQDLTAQREILTGLGVAAGRIYLTRDSPALSALGPDRALAAVCASDTLMVPKLDRLARPRPDARDIGDTLVARGAACRYAGPSTTPGDPMSKMFFNMLTVFAEFEVDLLKMRTRKGMAIASSRGRLKGKSPSSLPASRPSWSVCAPPGGYTIADLMEGFSVGRANRLQGP